MGPRWCGLVTDPQLSDSGRSAGQFGSARRTWGTAELQGIGRYPAPLEIDPAQVHADGALRGIDAADLSSSSRFAFSAEGS